MRGVLPDLLALEIVGAVLAAMEWSHPYFFLQDDNRTGQLGLLVSLWRAVSAGELPLYNFHQFLGTPTLSFGPMPIFYLPIYVAFWVCERFSGHPDAAIDLLVILHLAFGALTMRRLGSTMEWTRGAQLFAAVTWPLASAVIFLSASWWLVCGVVAFLPVLLRHSFLLLREGRRWSVLALVAARLALLYIGHPQFFTYAVSLEVLWALLMVLSLGRPGALGALRRNGMLYAASLVLTAALGLPFVQPLWAQTRVSAERAMPFNYWVVSSGRFEKLAWLQGVLDPFRADPDYYRLPLGLWQHRAFPYLSFTGYTTLLVLIAFVAWRMRRKDSPFFPSAEMRSAFALLVLALWWAFGALDPLLYWVPPFNRFRWSFKVMLFASFFTILLAGFAWTALDRWLQPRLSIARRRALVAALIAFQGLTFGALYAAWPQRTLNFRSQAESPPLQDPLADRLREGRAIAIGFASDDPYGSRQLAYDYASLWGLFQYSGYGNLISAQHATHVFGLINDDGGRPQHDGVFKGESLPIDYFRFWGIRWYLLAKNRLDPRETENYRKLFEGLGLSLAAEDAARFVYDDAAAKPLAWFEVGGGPARVGVEGSSLRCDFPAAAGTRRLVLNFLFDAQFEVHDSAGAALAIEASPADQAVVTVPAGATSLVVRYWEPGFRLGLRNGGLVALLVGVALWLSRARR